MIRSLFFCQQIARAFYPIMSFILSRRYADTLNFRPIEMSRSQWRRFNISVPHGRDRKCYYHSREMYKRIESPCEKGRRRDVSALIHIL